MRAFVAVLAALAGVGCGQKVDHPELAPACDPGECFTPPEGSQGGGKGGTSSSDGGEQLAAFSGQLITFADDFFDQGTALSTSAQVSATGKSGARVKADYDGASFDLEDVLKAAGNWFLVEPTATGLLPTLQPVDTRSTNSGGLTLGVAQNLTIDGIFALLGTERSTERAQVVLHVVDAKGVSVLGVKAALTAERIAYRTASAWLSNDEGTDDSGMIFLGNVQVGSALTTTTIALSGSASARVSVAIQAGVTTIATVVVTPK
jgi:hypothetical protein